MLPGERSIFHAPPSLMTVTRQDPSYFKHLGFYAYRKPALDRFCKLPESSLERCERLEQLRFLENGIPIHVAETPYDTVGVDTEEDLRRVEEILQDTRPVADICYLSDSSAISTLSRQPAAAWPMPPRRLPAAKLRDAIGKTIPPIALEIARPDSGPRACSWMK